jgi:hypothetical protein
MLFLLKFVNMLLMLAAFPFSAVGFTLGLMKNGFVSGWIYSNKIFRDVRNAIERRSRFL